MIGYLLVYNGRSSRIFNSIAAAKCVACDIGGDCQIIDLTDGEVIWRANLEVFEEVLYG